MRELNNNDFFKICRILKKMNLKISDIDIDESEDSDQNFVFAIIDKIIYNADLAQADVNDFFGDIAGMTGEQFGKLPLKETLKLFDELKKMDGVADFFDRVGQRMKEK